MLTFSLFIQQAKLLGQLELVLRGRRPLNVGEISFGPVTETIRSYSVYSENHDRSKQYKLRS